MDNLIERQLKLTEIHKENCCGFWDISSGHRKIIKHHIKMKYKDYKYVRTKCNDKRGSEEKVESYAKIKISATVTRLKIPSTVFPNPHMIIVTDGHGENFDGEPIRIKKSDAKESYMVVEFTIHHDVPIQVISEEYMIKEEGKTHTRICATYEGGPGTMQVLMVIIGKSRLYFPVLID